MQDNPYEDIINMPHHVSRRRPQMSMHNRAAQFTPFAALSGYGEAIDETARTTDAPRDLLEDEAEELNLRLQTIAATHRRRTVSWRSAMRSKSAVAACVITREEEVGSPKLTEPWAPSGTGRP